jgi:hypothetical protein
MATTQEEIRGWFQRGKKNPCCTHLIVVCDTFDHEDYPVFVKTGEDVRQIEKNHSGNMQRVMEVYSMSMDMETQIAQPRAFNY